MTQTTDTASTLIDPFGRQIDYVRLSVTDRCDFRCVYCMSESMQFLPRHQVLTLEELYQLSRVFVGLGVRKIRLTGGEPLVRCNVLSLIERVAALPGLRELVLTSNGSQLARMAPALKAAGLARINISLDSLDPVRFKAMTRTGELSQVLRGIEMARQQDFAGLKINCVIQRGQNEAEILPLLDFALERGLDISFIEEMPLGQVQSHDRQQTHITSAEVKARIAQRYTLLDCAETTGGPSRYYRIPGYAQTRVGFISPLSQHFCATCNRVRVTAEGRLLLCLGQENSVDLKRILRACPGDAARLRLALQQAMARKPWGHDFDLQQPVQIVRFMNMTGG